MKEIPILQKHRPILLLLLFCAVIFIGTAFQPGLVDDADATHAEAAKEILLRNDWVTLYVNGVRYLEKAPLLYWLVASAYKLFGFTAFAVRLPTMLAIVLLVGTVYLFGQWAYSRKVGFYGAAVMGFCTGAFLFTRIMIPEALLTLLLTVAHLCFLKAFLGKGTEKRWYYGFYAASAFAVLTKGLIGVVFAIAPAFLFLVLTRNFSRWRELKLLSGTALLLAIAAPWHLLAGFQNENFFWFYFVNEHFLRFLGKRYPMDYNKLPFLQYWLLHLVWLFPWSLAVPLLVQQLPFWQERGEWESGRVGEWESGRVGARPTPTSSHPTPAFPYLWLARLKTTAAAQVTLYLWLWAGVILIFFNISTSQEYYTFPAYPALALLLGLALATAEDGKKTVRYLVWMNGILAAIGVGVAGVLAVLVWNALHVQNDDDLSTLLNLAPSDSQKYTLSMGHFLDLTPQSFAALEFPAIGAALVLGIGFLLAFWFRWHRRHTRATIAMLLTMGLFFVCANRAHILFEPVLSSRFMAVEVMQRWKPNAKIVINGEYEAGSALAFYTNQQVLLLDGRKTGMEFGSRYPDAPPIFLDIQDVQRLWQSDDRIFLFTETIKKDEFLNRLNLPTTLIDEKGGKSLLMNQPE